jgi:diaminopropionate ammonia-lyase
MRMAGLSLMARRRLPAAARGAKVARMIAPRPHRLLLNRNHGTPGLVVLPEGGWRRARAEITSWPGYQPTPLRSLPEIAAEARIGALHYKDEGGRFGLGSFKALGGAYAVKCLAVAELARRGMAPAEIAAALSGAGTGLTVCCATDGNHGRSVAWGAQRFAARCVIFVHEHVSQGRRDAIAAYGAEIRVVPGTYDDAVRAAAATAEREGWFVVSDTSYPGYTEIPRDVMQGYRLMAEEALTALPAAPTHVFIQGGVGGVAAAVATQLRASGAGHARLVVAEPENAACLLASAQEGKPSVVTGALDTLMAGLACGEVSLLAWQELERSAFAFMALPDAAAVDCMRLLKVRGITAGESAVAGLAGLLLAAQEPFARAMLGLDEHSQVLVFGTEGATDPDLYARLTA